MKMQKTSQYTLERSRDGQASAWYNPNNGNSGTVTPTRTVKENGRYCREYQQTVTIDGNTQKAYGKACRQPDGSWNIKS
jgi:surface antigen